MCVCEREGERDGGSGINLYHKLDEEREKECACVCVRHRER